MRAGAAPEPLPAGGVDEGGGDPGLGSETANTDEHGFHAVGVIVAGAVASSISGVFVQNWFSRTCRCRETCRKCSNPRRFYSFLQAGDPGIFGDFQ